MRYRTDFHGRRRGTWRKKIACLALWLIAGAACGAEKAQPKTGKDAGATVIKLKRAAVSEASPVAKVIARRRSVRQYSQEPIPMQDIGELLWAAQGITSPRGFRAAPSAGALYPLELYVVVANGVYRYDPRAETLTLVVRGDVRKKLAQAAYGQTWVAQAPATIVFAAVYERVTRKYGTRGVRYTHMEVGHAAENLMLRAVEMGLGTVAVGAFDEAYITHVLKLPAKEVPVYLIPVGKPRS